MSGIPLDAKEETFPFHFLLHEVQLGPWHRSQVSVESTFCVCLHFVFVFTQGLILILHLETIKPKPGDTYDNADLHKWHWLFHFHSLIRYIYFSDISLTGIDCTIIAYFFGPLAVNLEVTRVKLARPPLSALTSHYAVRGCCHDNHDRCQLSNVHPTKPPGLRKSIL